MVCNDTVSPAYEQPFWPTQLCKHIWELTRTMGIDIILTTLRRQERYITETMSVTSRHNQTIH